MRLNIVYLTAHLYFCFFLPIYCADGAKLQIDMNHSFSSGAGRGAFVSAGTDNIKGLFLPEPNLYGLRLTLLRRSAMHEGVLRTKDRD
jgi:hypothetical protein